MSNLSHLEPKSVFSFFEQLAALPHGSGNTAAISDFCVRFAKDRALWYRQDALGNVLIKKPASPDKKDSAPLLIQGHLDMVCEKDPSLIHLDMAKDPLALRVKDDLLFAEGTTLGADDGIAVAYALAILDADNLSHPPLEVIFTVDEEIGLLGAASMDLSDIEGRRMLNIDSEEEGIFLTSCAGGATATCTLPVRRENRAGLALGFVLSGLLGGHSGVEIDKNRGNAALLLSRFLHALSQCMPLSLLRLSGGLKDNAIPLYCSTAVVIPPEKITAARDLLASFDALFRREYQGSDPGVSLTLVDENEGSFEVLTEKDTGKVLNFLMLTPNGIQGMSANIAGLVESSLNLGILSLEEQYLTARFAVRSSLASRKQEMLAKLDVLCKMGGGRLEVAGDYPAWEYMAESPLRDAVCTAYQALFQKEPQLAAIHAGLECGFFAGKIPGLDCLSIGPDIFDIHTTKERLSISSTARTWSLLLEVLRTL